MQKIVSFKDSSNIPKQNDDISHNIHMHISIKEIATFRKILINLPIDVFINAYVEVFSKEKLKQFISFEEYFILKLENWFSSIP